MLLGPLTFLLLGKGKRTLNPLLLLDKLLPVYEEVLRRLAQAGADWVQVDEPVLAGDLPAEAMPALESACARFSAASERDSNLFDHLFWRSVGPSAGDAPLPVAAVHLDLVRAPEQLDRALELTPRE